MSPSFVSGRRTTGPALRDYGTGRWPAQRKKKDAEPERFPSEEAVVLSQLPCWRHLSPEMYRDLVARLVREIESDAAAKRKLTGREPLGPQAILSQHPQTRPEKLKKSSESTLFYRKVEVYTRVMTFRPDALSGYRKAYYVTAKRLGQSDAPQDIAGDGVKRMKLAAVERKHLRSLVQDSHSIIDPGNRKELLLDKRSAPNLTSIIRRNRYDSSLAT